MARHAGRHPVFANYRLPRPVSVVDDQQRADSRSDTSDQALRQLFVNGTEQEVVEEIKNLERGGSILDTVMGDAHALNRTLGTRDREKLDEYFTSVRELEIRLQQNREWAKQPKPKVNFDEPQDIADRNDILAKQRLMYDLILLALQTDSTRG